MSLKHKGPTPVGTYRHEGEDPSLGLKGLEEIVDELIIIISKPQPQPQASLSPELPEGVTLRDLKCVPCNSCRGTGEMSVFHDNRPVGGTAYRATQECSMCLGTGWIPLKTSQRRFVAKMDQIS